MENTTPILPDTTGAKKEKYIISGIIFILAVAVAYLAWYVNGRPQTPPAAPSAPVLAPVAKEAVPAASPEAQASLGGDIYAQTQNPVKDKIPETIAPVSNPIDGAYKNPFQ
jgi:hypothetical protein